MRVQRLIGLFSFRVLVMLPTVWAQGAGEACGTDDTCDDNLCCMVNGLCSSLDSMSVEGGAFANDVCECVNLVYDADVQLCACDTDNDCPDELCCMVNSLCSTSNVGSVNGGESAIDECECVNPVYDAEFQLCGCHRDSQCPGNLCCMDTDLCSVNDEGSVAAGDAASDGCECVSGGLDVDLTTCACLDDSDCAGDTCCRDDGQCSSRDEGSVEGGLEADDACECNTSRYDANTGLCGCLRSSQCTGQLCCREDDSCSAADEESLLFGETATDSCECVSGILASDGETCACEEDDACEGNTCCMADGTCSSQEEGSVHGGARADDVCECNTGRYDEDSELCGCNRSDHCTGDTCCMANLACSSSDEETVSPGDVALDACECVSLSYDAENQICECTDDNQCNLAADEICCPDKSQCEVPVDAAARACGDPHMTGFHGQKFDFTGKDGEWYALISDLPSIHINMRVTAPVPSLPEITYITGLSVFTTDSDGDDHSIIISVKTPHSLRSECPSDGSVCLADGALSVILDGEETFTKPGTEILAPGVEISVANIPGECRSFGFEQYWERKKLEAAQGRRLQENETMGDWILGDPTMTNVNECIEYVNDAMDGDTLFYHQSEHASFRIVTPTATIRLSHGRLHQVAMRDPTDKFDLPDHLTWQMNMAIDQNRLSDSAQGVIGETFVPTRDANGDMIMHGMDAIRGHQEDYHVVGPLGVDFAQASYNP